MAPASAKGALSGAREGSALYNHGEAVEENRHRDDTIARMAKQVYSIRIFVSNVEDCEHRLDRRSDRCGSYCFYLYLAVAIRHIAPMRRNIDTHGARFWAVLQYKCNGI